MARSKEKNPHEGGKSAFQKPTPEEAPKTRSVDEIWSEAMEAIAKEYNVSSEDLEEKNGQLGYAETGIEKARTLFKNSRHPGDKKDKVAKTVGGCLDWVQDGLGFVKSNISGTYAVPVQVLTGSISYMVQAAQTVSEDFDLIESTFDKLDKALGDIGDLRQFNFRSNSITFLQRLTAIFAAMVKLCVLSGKVFLTSRKERWLKALIRGRDKQISKACTDVEKAIQEFRDSVPLQALGEIQSMSTAMQSMPDRLVEEMKTKMKYSELQPLWSRQQKSLDLIKDPLKKNDFFHDEVEARMEAQMGLVDKQLVDGTFSWMEDDLVYSAWREGRRAPYVYVQGSAGSGKTFFACHCYKSIQKRSVQTMATSENSSERKRAPFVTYFPFKIGREESQGLGSILGHTIIQVAMKDAKLRDSIANDLYTVKELSERGKDVDGEARIKTLWQNLLVKKFERTTEVSRELFIILDGIEAMNETDRKAMLDLFQDLSPEKCGIHVLMTGTESSLISRKGFGLSGCPKITLDEKIKNGGDISKIIKARIRNSKRLQQYNSKTWERVEEKLLEISNPISTVDITMTVMEQADTEVAGLEQIKKLTKQNGLHEALIRHVLFEKSDNMRDFFRFIFGLCTFAQRPLSIYIIQEFANQEPRFRKPDLDVAHHVETSLSNFLYVTNMSGSNEIPEADQGKVKPEDKIALRKEQMVTFRQVSFLEYLEKNQNDLIQKPVKSKVSFFVKLANLLCRKDTESAGLRAAFQDYAAQWFMYHLSSIDVKEADPMEGRQVVEALSRVFRNDGAVSRIFEDLSGSIEYYSASETDVYDLSTVQGSTGFQNLKVLREWANKMNFHNEEDLSSQAKRWVEGTIHEPSKMLEELARGHFQRWTETKIYDEAIVPYRFLCRCLQLRKGWSEDTMEAGVTLVKSLLAYAEEGKFIRKPIQLARCQISAALVLYNNNTFSDADKEFARELYQTILDQESSSWPEKFYSHVGLAEHFYRASLSQQASEDKKTEKLNLCWNSVRENANEALRAWFHEKGALGSDLNEERCIKAFVLKAQALHKLGSDVKAIQACHRCLEEGFQYNPQISELLALLVDIYAKNKNWASIIDIVWRQKPTVRAEFLNHLFYESDTLERADLVMEAATRSNRVDYLIRMVEGGREYGQDRDSPQAFVMTYMLGIIYQIVARTPRMAEDLMSNGVSDSDRFSMAHATLVFPRLVTIYQEYFASACSEKAQMEAIRKVEGVIKSYEKNFFQDSSCLSMAVLSLAKMYLALGNTQQAVTHANRAFDICVVDLEDSIASNDRGAFRALSKLLAFVGLREKAQVALSLQFSRVGWSLSGHDDEDNELDGVPQQETFDMDQNSQGSGREELANGTSAPGPNAYDDSPNSASTTSQLPSEPPEAGKAEDLLEQPVAHAKEQAERPEKHIEDERDKPSDKQTKEPPKHRKQPGFKSSQDLSEAERGVSCDGVCEPNLEIFSFEPDGPKLMYCLDCMDVDFCEACHRTQIDFFDKGGEGFWFKCCWSRHNYLQAPIDGWLGVRKGFIYIEHKAEDKVEQHKVQWEDWLRGVKSCWNTRIRDLTVWNKLALDSSQSHCSDNSIKDSVAIN